MRLQLPTTTEVEHLLTSSNRDFLQERSLLVFALEPMGEKEKTQENTLEQTTRPASLSITERMPLSGPVSEVCAMQKL
ncbi:hypothetical protein PsorP6_015953 [Peronosclerospora sorghi]|uniref:Uncharacterized protein n=1 Tax=Peronosclerospora sorghi TaxID=230839 RepID=A0ACC0WMH5_9STRA|nr:hypothetical protein PsorP6_015953 [Peronosclerospora sorghi]